MAQSLKITVHYSTDHVRLPIGLPLKNVVTLRGHSIVLHCHYHDHDHHILYWAMYQTAIPSSGAYNYKRNSEIIQTRDNTLHATRNYRWYKFVIHMVMSCIVNEIMRDIGYPSSWQRHRENERCGYFGAVFFYKRDIPDPPSALKKSSVYSQLTSVTNGQENRRKRESHSGTFIT